MTLQDYQKAFDEMLERRKLLDKKVNDINVAKKPVQTKNTDFKPSLHFVDYPDKWQSQLEYWRLD